MVARFKILLDNLQLTASEFAEKIGVQRSSISHILSGRNKPSVDFLVKILHAFPDVNLEWLIGGKGNWNKTIPVSAVQKQGEHIRKDSYINEEMNKGASPDESLASENMTLAQSIEGPVDHIVIVYQDNTFRILNPSERK